MTQAYKQQAFEVEEREQEVSKKTNKRKAKNSLGSLNPRYFENARTPKKAKNAYTLQKMYTFNNGF